MSAIRSQLLGRASAILVVQLPREIVDDAAEAIRLEVVRRLPQMDKAAVILDCSEVELINSIGITCLLQVQEHCRRNNAALVIAALCPNLLQFLKTLRLDRRFTLHESVEDSVAQLEGG